MRIVDDGDDPAARGEVVDEVGVGVLHEPARVRLADDRLEARRVVDGVDDRQPFTLADLAVDLAEGGGEVHDARAVVDGDEVVGDDRERPVALDGLEHRERRLVARADERGRGDVGDDLGVGAEHVGDAAPGHDEVAPAFGRAHAYVVDRGPTAAPTFDGNVHGVVVQTSRSSSRPTSGKRT